VEVPCVATLIWNLRVRFEAFIEAEKHLAKTHGKTPRGSYGKTIENPWKTMEKPMENTSSSSHWCPKSRGYPNHPFLG